MAGTVVVVDGLIAASGDAPVVDLGNRWIAPGFIDLHVHGGGGAQFNTDAASEVAEVAAFHARHGTTSLLATTVAAAVPDLLTSLHAIRAAADERRGARILGAHLEGPFVSRDRPGAMDAASFLRVDLEVARRLVLAAEGCVSMMTLAPELPGALELIGELVEAGVVVSLGHSAASFEQAVAAVRAGARSVTHLFNAMAPFGHRAPGLVGAALELAELNCELICDGVHVDPVGLRLALRSKGAGGLRLVTDAVSAAGMPDGVYPLGPASVLVLGGRATVAGLDTLAGSTLTMDAAVRNAVGLMGVSVPDAVAMASSVPARVLGLDDRLGSIAPGFDADLVVLDDELRAVGTMVGGRWVGDPPGGVA